MNKKVNYGIDAPGVIRNLFIIGIVVTFIGLFLLNLQNIFIKIAAFIVVISGAVCIVEGILMILYSKVGKYKHRERILAMVTWKGNEKVVDIGTGNGLLMIGAAQKLTSGKSIGIDIWKSSDLTNNTYQQVLMNAKLEDVQNKVEILNADAQKMPFKDNEIDVFLSNLCLHNIPSSSGRKKACDEIVRTLKPGGVAIISDFIHTKEYYHEFKHKGLEVTLSAPFYLDTFPPLRIIKAVKPD